MKKIFNKKDKSFAKFIAQKNSIFKSVLFYLHRQVVRAETKTYIFACIKIRSKHYIINFAIS